MTAIDKIARYILLSLIWLGAFGISATSMTWNNRTDFMSVAVLIGAGVLSGIGAWQPSGNLDKVTRYGFLTVIWAFALLMNIPNTNSYDFGLTPIIALFSVLYTTYKLFPRYLDEAKVSPPASITQDAKEKRKNGELNPLDILTEDDLYDLRQEIKDEIRNRIFSGSEGELSSLDALLDAQDRKTTRN